MFTSEIFQLVAQTDTLKRYHYCFNFVPQIYQADVREGMGELNQVHFLKFLENPYLAYDFTDAEKILEEYMPIKIENNGKKSIVSLFKGRSKNGG